MISDWTSNLKSDAEKVAFQNQVLGAKSVLKRLQDIMDQKMSVETAELNPAIYDTPNWDYKQADLNGFKRCLKQISTIINLDQGNT